MQSRKGSAAEATANMVIGFAVGMAMNYWTLPWFGFHPTTVQSFSITLLFTIVTLLRSYLLRRLFTHLTESEYL